MRGIFYSFGTVDYSLFPGNEYLFDHKKGSFRGVVQIYDADLDLVEIKLTTTRPIGRNYDYEVGERCWIRPCPAQKIDR